MDANFYAPTYNPHSHYSQPQSVYSVHSNFPAAANIYSTFASTVFLDQNSTQNGAYRPKASHESSPRLSAKSSKKTRSSEHASSKQHSTYNTFPSGYSSYRANNNIYSNYNYGFNPNSSGGARGSSNPYFAAYHNNKEYNNVNSEDIFLVLEDAYEPNKRIVQMTRTILGPDGEQQRVTIERDFKNEVELNNFLKQFGDSLNKKGSGGHERSSGRKSTASTAHKSSHKQKRNTSNDMNDFKKPPG